MARGGYRQPANPAPVSGPGRLSRRTDGGPQQTRVAMPDAAYGEQQEMQAIQSGAPMVADPGVSQGGPGPVGPSPVGLDAPTQRPDEPITAGAPFGPGPGPAGGGDPLSDDMRIIAKYLPSLEAAANDSAAPQSFRNFVRYVRGWSG